MSLYIYNVIIQIFFCIYREKLPFILRTVSILRAQSMLKFNI